MRDKNEQAREAIKAECVRRGITITQRGKGFELKGIGVDLSVIDLAYLVPSNLDPYVSRDSREARAVV